MSWFDTPASEILGTRLPVVHDPVSALAATPELVAAVCGAGGLGVLAAGEDGPEALREAMRRVRSLSDRPFGVKLDIARHARPNAARMAETNALLDLFRDELGLARGPDPAPLPPPELEPWLAAVIEGGAAAVLFSGGAPEPGHVGDLRRAGLRILATATHLLEAIVLEECGAELIVAQGAEAAGHRASFLGTWRQGMIGTMALVPLLAEHLRVPVLACGGIMDGRGIAAARMLGAAGVQMGTAFLACPESGINPAHRRALLEGSEIVTAVSPAFTGRPARTLKNQLCTELHGLEADLPGYPHQAALTRDIREEAERQQRLELMALWAGQGCGACRAEPAAEQLSRWAMEAAGLPDGAPRP